MDYFTAGVGAFEGAWHGKMHVADHYPTLEEARAHEVFNWTAIAAPVLVQMPENVGPMAGTLVTVPKRTAIIRSTDGAILATNGDQYAIHQPTILLDWIERLESLSDGAAKLETFFSIREGRTIVALLNLRESGYELDTILADGRRDHVQPYGMFSTSFDGTTATQGQDTAVRAVCWNTFQCALGGAEHVIKIRHSGDTEQKTAQAAKLLDAWITRGERSQEMAREMSAVEMTESAVKSIMELVIPAVPKDAAKATETRQENKMELLTQGIQAEVKLLADPSQASLWTLFNGVTRFADHLMTTQPRGKDATEVKAEHVLISGRGMAAKDKARDAILEIARA